MEKLPADVKEAFLSSLTVARLGSYPPSAKPWKGEGSGVYELVVNHDGDTYRCAYTVEFSEALYVLHVFKKKSKSGVKTPKMDVDLVGTRLVRARGDYDTRYKKKKN